MTEPSRSSGPRDLEQRVLDTWDFADPAATAEHFRRAADEEPTNEASAVLRTQQARATGVAGDFEAASRILEEIESAGLDESATHARARLAIERGRVLNSTGDPAACRGVLRRSPSPGHGRRRWWARPRRPAHERYRRQRSRRTGSSPALERAGAVRGRGVRGPAIRRWRGPVLNNLGWDLHDAGRPEEALAVFERAVEVREEAGQAAEALIARWCVGRTLRTLGRYDEALALMRELAAEPGAREEYVHEEIAANVAALARWNGSNAQATSPRAQPADQRVGAAQQGGPDGRVDAVAAGHRDVPRRGRPGRRRRGNIPPIRPKTLSMPPPASLGISSR